MVNVVYGTARRRHRADARTYLRRPRPVRNPKVLILHSGFQLKTACWGITKLLLLPKCCSRVQPRARVVLRLNSERHLPLTINCLVPIRLVLYSRLLRVASKRLHFRERSCRSDHGSPLESRKCVSGNSLCERLRNAPVAWLRKREISPTRTTRSRPVGFTAWSAKITN